ncbi:hypothetical protein [Chromobacterium violaceum]|uniref:hypothetical protein n=1 Tax=Chromobacterium violaceum TaxID=536 RepID=UPI0005D35ECA|nr:hypothetical protein [Chromobacterium violaceum]KJH65897.1 hypothetical protein UF16_18895 [Chromobacterium violaceum]
MSNSITLLEIEPINWQGFFVPVYLAKQANKPLCGPIVFADDMPAELRALFELWLEHRQLSITMPPALPRAGQAYYLDDLTSAIEGAGTGSD